MNALKRNVIIQKYKRDYSMSFYSGYERFAVGKNTSQQQRANIRFNR